MEGPRSPETHEWSRVVDFLNSNLRQNKLWPITSEYPTALSANNIHNMSIITEDEKIIAHAVLKTFIIKTPYAIFKVGAIGSVITAPEHRQKGHSRRNIEKCMELAHRQDCDIVILWTDQFDFYRKLGFELAGFDYNYLLETPIPIKNNKLRFETGNNVDPMALQKLYSHHTVHAVRNIEDFRQFLKIPNSNLFTAWDQNNQLVAYAAEGKGADLVNYIHEWGGQVEPLLDLFQYIRQQKNEVITIMAPSHSENLRHELEKIASLSHQGYLGMMKIVSTTGLLEKIKKAFRAEGHDKFVLEHKDGQFVFGFGTELYTLEKETDLVQLLFGPLSVNALNFVSEEARQKCRRCYQCHYGYGDGTQYEKTPFTHTFNCGYYAEYFLFEKTKS